MKIWNIYFLILIGLLTSSCGFKPIYKADNNKHYQLLESVEIELMHSIEGADFYNHLKNILPPNSDSKYQIITNIVFIENYSIIQDNADVLRAIITAQVSFKLIDKKTDKILLNSSFSRPSSYSTTFSPYSNLIQKHEVLKNLSIMVAEEIRNRLIIHFYK